MLCNQCLPGTGVVDQLTDDKGMGVHLLERLMLCLNQNMAWPWDCPSKKSLCRPIRCGGDDGIDRERPGNMVRDVR